jgi:hypothetical protein
LEKRLDRVELIRQDRGLPVDDGGEGAHLRAVATE